MILNIVQFYKNQGESFSEIITNVFYEQDTFWHILSSVTFLIVSINQSLIEHHGQILIRKDCGNYNPLECYLTTGLKVYFNFVELIIHVKI